MNLAGLTTEFSYPDAVVTPSAHHISALILDRNPVLSQCVSSSLSAFQSLDCKALQFDASTPPTVELDAAADVFVFDPAQIGRPLDAYLADFGDARGLRTVAYSFDTTDATVNKVLDAGVDCYASKEQDLLVLYLAIATAARGGQFLCPTIAKGFHRIPETAAPALTDEADPKAVLSTRELAVLSALASGLSQKQTAFKLDLSDKTVSTYKSRAMRKLGLTDRASIVQFAMEQNLIAPGLCAG